MGLKRWLMTKYLYVIVQTADVKYSHETMLCDALGCHTPAQIPSSLPCHKSTPYKVRVFFVSLSMQSGREVAHPVPTMAVSQPSVGMSPSPSHDSFTAKPSSHRACACHPAPLLQACNSQPLGCHTPAQS